MIVDQKHRVLIVSGRLLVAQGLMSLLGDMPNIGHVEIAESLFDAVIAARESTPDLMVVDMPAGADFFVDRPMQINGREIKTIVLQEDENSGEALLYVHAPGVQANLVNLASAVSGGEPSILRHKVYSARMSDLAEESPAIPVAPQPSSFMSASASGPSKPRMSASRPGL